MFFVNYQMTYFHFQLYVASFFAVQFLHSKISGLWLLMNKVRYEVADSIYHDPSFGLKVTSYGLMSQSRAAHTFMPPTENESAPRVTTYQRLSAMPRSLPTTGRCHRKSLRNPTCDLTSISSLPAGSLSSTRSTSIFESSL